MTKDEFKEAFALAESQADLSEADIDVFCGFANGGYGPVYVTIQQVARLIRWQAQYLNGQWDNEALREIAERGRGRFQIVNATTTAA